MISRDELRAILEQHFPDASATARVPLRSTTESMSATGGSARMLTDGRTMSNAPVPISFSASSASFSHASSTSPIPRCTNVFVDPRAPEFTRGFLLNHLIDELLPERGGGHRYANSDPVTGQAAWYDLRVRLEKIERRA